jgi:hypothetical protein
MARAKTDARRQMNRVIWIAALAVLLPTAAFAEDGSEALIPYSYSDGAIFVLAAVVTVWWSMQAFDRPAISLADLPTFPRYMTRHSQYLFAKFSFVVLSLGIYSLMVRYHRELPEIIAAVNPDWAAPLKNLIEQKDPSYLVVVVIASAGFLALLQIEARWNFLLLIRDILYSWVSIPYLTNKIVTLTQDQLIIPASARSKIEQTHPEWRVHAADFEKNPLSMDRAWAELCYLQWWILERRREHRETTFFSETSFAYEDLKDDLESLNLVVNAHKQGLQGADEQSSRTMKSIADQRRKLCRLIACFIVFMNSTQSAVIAAAGDLGIELGPRPSENPLRYAAIYIVTLILAIYVGVFASAVVYDVFQGVSLGSAISEQDLTDVQRWMALAFGDYGIPILGILTLRYLAWLANPVRGYSVLVAYAWIFLISATLSTIGLSIMSELFGRNAGHWGDFSALFLRGVRWSIGPALICVYINHYMDRQADPSRLDIGPLGDMPLRRIAYAMLFTALVMAFTLPSMPTIQKFPEGVWDVSKLRFVAMGNILCITICLALVAQFALVKPHRTHPAPVPAPQS